jgi:SAM-dependent methyltransferase
MFIVNGAVVAQTIANEYRHDLLQAGIGSGHLGYSFKLRRPGLASGDRVEIKNAATGAILYQSSLDLAQTSGIDAAYDLLDEITFEGPFWRPLLFDIGGGNVSLQGELFLPHGTTTEAALYEDGGRPVQATIKPASSDIAGRYWWLDGWVMETQYDATPSEHRVILWPTKAASADVTAPLNFGVVPSRTDLANFRFAGKDRARRVAGGDDSLVRFAGGGLTAALQILTIAKSSPNLTATAKVLDWGCGAARVLQFLKAERPGWDIHGVDIDAVNIDWCKANIPGLATFQKTPLNPPLGYPDESFDLIYGLSVITHLEEATRNAWIRELARVTKKGGTCVLTYHSAFHILQHGISPWAVPLCGDLAVRGISDRLPDPALGADLSVYYKSTYNTFANLHSAVCSWFDVVARYPKAMLYQDTLVLRRRAS